MRWFARMGLFCFCLEDQAAGSMASPDVLADERIQELRQEYNAQVVYRRLVNEDLLILRVRGDSGIPRIVPGQYTILGLGNWEPRIDGVPRGILAQGGKPALLRRAYSVSCPVLDESAQLVTISQLDYLEFYIRLIHKPSDDPPPLTPRLFALRDGDRVFLGMRAHGRYTLARVHSDDDVVFAATGTGEAPHNAMLPELLSGGHRGRIVSAVSVRYRRDLAYERVHRDLERQYPNYRYIALTTREPENVDPGHTAYRGKQYLQELFAGNRFLLATGCSLDPGRTHIFLCGIAAMIGNLRTDTERQTKPAGALGMAEILMDRGFCLDRTDRPGNLHVELY